MPARRETCAGSHREAIARYIEMLEIRGFYVSLPEDGRRPGRPSPLRELAGFVGYDRLSPVRDERGMKEAGGRSRLYSCEKGAICREFTGATGLEPATSGVTGRRSNQLNYAPGAD